MASRSIKNRPDVKKKNKWAAPLAVLAVFIAVVAAGVGGVWALGESWLQDLPEYKNVDQFNTARKTTVYANDRTTVLAEFYLEDREPVEIDQISQYVLEGTVATEDERFYEHGGFDLWGIARAVVVNLTGSSREGASTITQQFVRNTILSAEANDISIKRKVREMYLSMKIEEVYSKDEILLMYLNTINYGSGAYGIEAAAQRYFSKSAADLTLVEAATLIGIPQSPTYNNPIDYPDACQDRRNLVLNRMLTNGYITQAEYDEAVNTPLELNVTERSNDGIYKYPYFTSYVREYLLEQYSTSEIFEGGWTVYTTIDPTLQDEAEAAAQAKRDTLADNFDVAMTVVDPETGYVKAMVGGRDYYANQWNFATQAERQPGSSFKTFTLIAALEAGISPQTMVDCSTTMTVDGAKISNIYNINYGTRSIARAFAVSSNTGFVRLSKSLGPEKVAEVAERMGISSELRPVATLTLGTSEVTTIDMAEAYGAIANGGVKHDAIGVEQILDRNGNVIEDHSTDSGERVITPEVASAATQVMQGVINTSEGTGTRAALASGQPVAGKTGTSDNYSDIWFCGFTPQLSVAIWIGDPRSITEGRESLSSDETATTVFRDFMTAALEGQPIEQFKTASAPPYKTYTDSKWNIGGSSSSSSDDEDEEAKKKAEEDAKKKQEEEDAKKNEEDDKKDLEPAPDPEPTPDPDPEPTPTPDPDPPVNPSSGAAKPASYRSIDTATQALGSINFAWPSYAVRNDWISELSSGNGISFRTISLSTA